MARPPLRRGIPQPPDEPGRVRRNGGDTIEGNTRPTGAQPHDRPDTTNTMQGTHARPR